MEGRISSSGLFDLGLILFAVKHYQDRLTGIYFGKIWYITDYFVQADKLAVHELAKEDHLFYLVMLLQSIPFIWFGTALCVKRLRNTKLPSWMDTSNLYKATSNWSNSQTDRPD